MIDFACRQFDLDEVIRCGFGISKTEYKIFKEFISNKSKYFQTNEIEKMLGLDLSTVQRAVKKLYELGVLQRAQTNLSGGGYVFSYRIKNKDEIKRKVLEVINNWNKRVESELDSW